MKAIYILLVLMVLFGAVTVSAIDTSDDNSVHLLIFYGRGCPHCVKEEGFLKDMEEKYPTLEVHRYEVYFDKDNRQLLENLVMNYNTEIGGVPTTFINSKVITGFSDSISRNIEQEIIHCAKNICQNPLESIEKDNNETITITGDASLSEEPGQTKVLNKLTIGAVIIAATVDAINPCAFAVLIILLSTILAAGKRKRVLAAGLAFTASIYISYLLMGLGLFSALQAAGLTRTFYLIVSVLAIAVGLFNLKDYLRYGKWFVMEVPMKWRPKMKSLLKGVTSVPGAFLIGFVISLFLLPCTSGPYIVILGMLAKTATKEYAMMLLLLYNFVFVLPMIIITLLIYFGFTTTARAEHWRTRKIKILHLIAGIIMLILGGIMLITIGLGYV
ncbi:cytochrome c biogenesis protein [Candidatus Woesearchaeota archaeon]|nr:cytochrome c biogenesis protein [Candidatus Woesearchaeota archaeon]